MSEHYEGPIHGADRGIGWEIHRGLAPEGRGCFGRLPDGTYGPDCELLNDTYFGHETFWESEAKRVVAVWNAFWGWTTERIEQATADKPYEIVILHAGESLQQKARRQRQDLDEAKRLLLAVLAEYEDDQLEAYQEARAFLVAHP
jgi:hypothetical protein